MEPRISGTFVARSGETYAYDGFWREVDKKVQWSAKVRKGGEIVGTPSGVVENVSRHTDIDRFVKTSIETTIQEKIDAKTG